MNAYQMNQEVRERFARRGIVVTLENANMLRRACMTLSRWAEQECGDSDNYKSWAIERDEETGKAYMAVYPHDGKSRRYAIPDRETGALKRVAKYCAEHGLFYYHQTDPRGSSLYIGTEPLTDGNYSTEGVSCWVSV